MGYEKDLSVDDQLSFLHEYDHITLARVYLAQYKTNPNNISINDATSLLERLLKEAEDGKRVCRQIEILILQVLVFEAQGNIPAALPLLERALRLAEPEGYFNIFVDEGPPMAHLLYEVISDGILPNFIQQLLAAFPNVEIGSNQFINTSTL